ncbi:beta-propeller fold lactonase family protein [Bradyrhizobium zhanjiangense]|uniref:beta-propeller fold lactonase family protein n=1 Tax=Bradyrhizobium zhanjiangense TaxID=1325107 RepID=UPI001FE1ECBB|nr:beta-propeller fold lactonase family protein [Bradyrhizobium zhanjiangense]
MHGDLSDITAMAIDPASGKLAVINRQSTEGKNPVHLAIDPKQPVCGGRQPHHLHACSAVPARGWGARRRDRSGQAGGQDRATSC